MRGKRAGVNVWMAPLAENDARNRAAGRALGEALELVPESILRRFKISRAPPEYRRGENRGFFCAGSLAEIAEILGLALVCAGREDPTIAKRLDELRVVPFLM